MAEYISRKAAIAYIREQSEECQKAFEELGGESGIYADAYNDLAENFCRIPAADVAPVRHGRWLHTDLAYHWTSLDECSVCGYHDEKRRHLGDYSYCPNCGAKMDGGVDNAKSV